MPSRRVSAFARATDRPARSSDRGGSAHLTGSADLPLHLPLVRAVPADAPLPDDADVVVLGVSASGSGGLDLAEPGAAVAAHLGVDVAAGAKQIGVDATAGSAGSIPLAALTGTSGPRPLVLVVGIGDGSAAAWRRAGAAVGSRTRAATHVVVAVAPARVQAFVEGLVLARWAPPRTGVKAKPATATQFDLAGLTDAVGIDRGLETATATLIARELAVTPSNRKNPAWMATQAEQLAGAVPGLTIEIRDAVSLIAQGFGGLLAVGAGSATPPYLVTVEWAPPRARRHVALVGKGITYDTGGISIKPREAMVPMKTDMTGSAVVLAAVIGAARLQLPVRVTAVLALAENAVGASSYRPSDVVTVWGGTTVEIANTDAEGRIVLADALAWSVATLAPDVVVDVATLTGAATLGLGRGHAALYATDDALADALLTAGSTTGELVWRLPLEADYIPAIRSDVADLRHVPESSPGGGSITAALFLREFVGSTPWAHLDIAGPARSDKAQHEIPKCATGFGARLLLEWLSATT